MGMKKPRHSQRVRRRFAVDLLCSRLIIAAFLPLFTLGGVEGNILGRWRDLCLCAAGGLLRPHGHTGIECDHPASYIHETETWNHGVPASLYVPV